MSTAPFHVAGMKCSACGSYNTSIEGPLQKQVQIKGKLLVLIKQIRIRNNNGTFHVEVCGDQLVAATIPASRYRYRNKSKLKASCLS
jgi:Zinc-ribbon